MVSSVGYGLCRVAPISMMNSDMQVESFEAIADPISSRFSTSEVALNVNEQIKVFEEAAAEFLLKSKIPNLN